jgi:hypothetical protein
MPARSDPPIDGTGCSWLTGDHSVNVDSRLLPVLHSTVLRGGETAHLRRSPISIVHLRASGTVPPSKCSTAQGGLVVVVQNASRSTVYLP